MFNYLAIIFGGVILALGCNVKQHPFQMGNLFQFDLQVPGQHSLKVMICVTNDTLSCHKKLLVLCLRYYIICQHSAMPSWAALSGQSDLGPSNGHRGQIYNCCLNLPG